MKFKAATFLVVDIAILGIVLGALWLFELTSFSSEGRNAVVATQHLLLPGLCLLVSFYYNDFYDLRVVRSFLDFCLHVPSAVGVAFILWAVLATIVQGLQPAMPSAVSPGAIVRMFLIVMSAVLLMRAVCYS